MIIKKKIPHRIEGNRRRRLTVNQSKTEQKHIYCSFVFAPRSTQLGVVVPNKSQFGFFCALHYAKYIFAVCPST